MAVLRNDKGEARTKTLGALVVIMVAAGIVALVLTLFGDNSNSSQAADQPSGSQVGNQSSAAATAATTPASTPASTPATTTPATTTPATATPASATPAVTTPATAPVTSSAAPKPTTGPSTKTSTKVVKYTVKKGDNLTLISGWFSQRGYGLVYDWNKSVIGRNPDLIFPGQTIIVSLTGDKMKVTTKNS